MVAPEALARLQHLGCCDAAPVEAGESHRVPLSTVDRPLQRPSVRLLLLACCTKHFLANRIKIRSNYAPDTNVKKSHVNFSKV